MRVCVIGMGYFGLVTGACLAHIGHQIICVDKSAKNSFDAIWTKSYF